MPKKQSIVDKAKAVPVVSRSSPVRDAEIELALAWMRGELTLKQVSIAGGIPYHSALARLPLCLREAYARGLVRTEV